MTYSPGRALCSHQADAMAALRLLPSQRYRCSWHTKKLCQRTGFRSRGHGCVPLARIQIH